MTTKKLTETPDVKQPDSCSTKLTGKTLLDFNSIKEDIEDRMPGIKLTASDVCRHALHIAAKAVREDARTPAEVQETL